jgi:nucleoside-diphosphate kinase
MKYLFSLMMMSALAGPSMLIAQSTQPRLEIQVEQLPSNQEGNYYDNSQGVENRQDQPSKTDPNQQVVVEQTLSIIKPDAVQNNHIGEIISRFERSGLRIAAIKMMQLTKWQAERFYQVHRDRPFYPELVSFMTSGPVVVMVLEGKNAIAKNRELMGATDPRKANPGTIRADLAKDMRQNAVHGSDSTETAKEEIGLFFQPNEIQKRF